MKNTNLETTFSVVNMGEFTLKEIINQDLRVLSATDDELVILANGIKKVAKIKSKDLQNKKFVINLEGFDFVISIKEEIDLVVNQLGFQIQNKASTKQVLSPMPGLVVNIFVEVGDKVAQGQKLLSLEAMKMENIIKSTSENVIKTISVNKQQSVIKNQILIEFE